jgi:hypothetical protein
MVRIHIADGIAALWHGRIKALWRGFDSMMIPTSVTTQRVVPTDATTTVAVEAEEALPSVEANPASRAAQAAIRPYNLTGGDGAIFELVSVTTNALPRLEESCTAVMTK